MYGVSSNLGHLHPPRSPGRPRASPSAVVIILTGSSERAAVRNDYSSSQTTNMGRVTGEEQPPVLGSRDASSPTKVELKKEGRTRNRRGTTGDIRNTDARTNYCQFSISASSLKAKYLHNSFQSGFVESHLGTYCLSNSLKTMSKLYNPNGDSSRHSQLRISKSYRTVY
jgi:hypothetical protein